MNTSMFIFKVFTCYQVQKPHTSFTRELYLISWNVQIVLQRVCFMHCIGERCYPLIPLTDYSPQILQMALQICTSVPMSVVVWVWSFLVLSIVWKMFQHAYHSLYWSLQKLISCVSFSYNPSCLNQYMLVCISDVAWLWTWSSFGLVFHK